MPAILQQTSASTYSGTTGTATFPGACTPGSIVVVLFNKESLSGTATVNDGANAGNYVADAFIQGGNGSAGSGGVGIYSKANTSSSALTVTLTLNASADGLVKAYELSGASATVDSTNTGQGQATVPSLSVTTVAANCSVFAIIGQYPGGDVAVDSGYTEAFPETAGSITYRYGEYNLNVGAAGVKTLTWDTIPAADNWNMAIAAYKAPANSPSRRTLLGAG